MPKHQQPKVAMQADFRMEKNEILIYDDIVPDDFFGGITAESFRDQLNDFGDASKLSIRINSDGGEVFNALSIYRAIVEHPAHVTMHVDGIAASSASMILMAGDEIRMAEAAFVMIHSPMTIAFGNAREMRETADRLEKVEDQFIGVYSDRTGASRDQIGQWMADETWFSSDEAILNGFATSISGNKAIAAKWDLSRCRNVPDQVVVMKSRDQTSLDDARFASHRMTTLRHRQISLTAG